MSHDEPCRCRRTEPEGRRSGRRAGAAAGAGARQAGRRRSCASSCFSCSACVGQWERALNQLNVASELDPSALAMAQIYGDAVRCEAIRDDVFDGKKSPMVFGEPDQWLALLIESLLRRRPRRARAIRSSCEPRAFDEAPASQRRHRRPAVRLDRRRRFAARPGARSGHQRPLLLGAVLPLDQDRRSKRRKTCATWSGCRRTCSSRTAASRSR